jgi:hypothetical protein
MTHWSLAAVLLALAVLGFIVAGRDCSFGRVRLPSRFLGWKNILWWSNGISAGWEKFSAMI